MSSAAQTLRMPNVEAQRAAMKKLSFLVGTWRGEAKLYRGGEPIEVTQTESAQYKLDGLILMIEGVGRTKAEGKVALQALGLLSYDDNAKVYRMRAFNDGRWLETDVTLAEGGKGLDWGFTFGEIRTKSVLRMNEKGEWTEHAEITFGTGEPHKLMEIIVRRQE